MFARLVAVTLVLLFGASSVVASGDSCDMAAKHEFIMWPADYVKVPLQCQYFNQMVYLSHGASFSCPHQFDLKIMAKITDDKLARDFCDTWVSVASNSSARLDFVVSIPLGEGGLGHLMSGVMDGTELGKHDVMHPFFDKHQTGPLTKPNVSIPQVPLAMVQVLYGRQFDIPLDLPSDPFLLFNPINPENGNFIPAFASRFVSGPPARDLIVKVDYEFDSGFLPSSKWPTLISVEASGEDALGLNQKFYDAHGRIVTSKGIRTEHLTVAPLRTIYEGQSHSDGFTGLDQYCGNDQAGARWRVCPAE